MAVTKQDIQKRLLEEQNTLSSKWLTKKQVWNQIRDRLKKSWNLWEINTILWGEEKPTSSPANPTNKIAAWIIPAVNDWVQKPVEDTIIEPKWELKTLREQVAWRIAWRKTEEQKLKDVRQQEWREELVDLRAWFREEASAVQTDLENISKWLKAEWWAITNIAASRIREGRSAPLREQLVSLVKWQELTSASLKDLDSSINWILQAREIDRQNEVVSLTNQIEWSSLTSEEKNNLLTQLWVQTTRMKREDELEAFKQKETVKAELEQKEQESIQSTWLTLGQNITLWKVINNFKVKEDSLIGQSVTQMIKEWRSEQEINRILGLATDEEWNFVNDTQFNRRKTLRNEFEKSKWVEGFRKANTEFEWLKSSLKAGNGAWDIAWLFQFMKTLDPTSVVREWEFDLIAKAAWLADLVSTEKIEGWITSGVILWPDQRNALQEVAEELFNRKEEAFYAAGRRSIENAVRDWVDPKSVVLDWRTIPWVEDIINWPITLDEQNEVDNEYWWTESITGKQYKLEDEFGFNNGETTSWTNIGIKNIWIWNVTQQFGATSPLKIDNVRLANWTVWTPWIDIDGKIWDPIPSTVAGTIKLIKSTTGLWNRVVIIDEQWNEHFFNHLDWFNVEDWQTVSKWEQIGTMWNSWSVIAWPFGDWSHLDYRVKSKNWWIDPNEFLIS